MKRVLCLAILLALLCGLMPAGAAETELVEIRNEPGNFTTRVPEGAGYKVDGNGTLVVAPDAGSAMPLVLATRRAEKYDPVDYLHVFRVAEMEVRFGDRLKGQVLRASHDIGGRSMPSVRFIYEDDSGNRINELDLWETRDDGDVEWSAFYLDDQQEAALALLDTVMRYYRPDAVSGGKAPGQTPEPKASETLRTVTYRDPQDRFSLLIPEGWRIVTDRDDDGFCYKVYDPAQPDRCFFLFMSLAPFLRDQTTKDFYVRNREFGWIYDYYAWAPVMEKPDMESFLAAYPEGRAAGSHFYPMGLGLGLNPAVYPQINNVGIVRRDGNFFCIRARDDAGNSLEGLVTAKAVSGFHDDFTNVDTYVVMNFSGIVVPEGEMDSLLPVLSNCFCSFSFNPAFVKNRIDLSEEWKNAMLAQGEYMQAMHDAMVQAWLGY